MREFQIDVDLAYYKELYFFLFNGITEIIVTLKNGATCETVLERLKLLQIESEEKYISR